VNYHHCETKRRDVGLIRRETKMKSVDYDLCETKEEGVGLLAHET